jgi:hypothetical protein
LAHGGSNKVNTVFGNPGTRQVVLHAIDVFFVP